MAFMKKGFPTQMLFLIALVVCFIGSATADSVSWDDVLDVRGIEDIDYDTFDLQRRDEESYLEVRNGNTPPVSPLTSTPPGTPRPVSPLSRHSSTKSNDRKDAAGGSKASGGLHRSNAIKRKGGRTSKRSNTPPVSPLTSTPPGTPRPVSPLSRHSSTKSNDRKDAAGGSKASGGLHRSNAIRRKGGRTSKRSNTPPVSPLTSTPPGTPRPVSPLSRHSSTKSNDRKDAGGGSKSSGGLHRSNAVRRKGGRTSKRSNTPPVSPLTSTPPGTPRPVSPLSRHSSTKSNDRKDAGGGSKASGGLHRSNAIKRKGGRNGGK
ncbi:unnamed protein product [Clonostachys solani]|uniref:Uncharacterized protein n=1 Tax=Clonostachys solani TaxID=160281 RepID=A0A9P0EQ36_9HYPO|nr:unnamed protein product [Clonostachys solani]